MLGYMNKEALAATLGTSLATFFSRSRQRLWQKGETSGNRLHVQGVFTDCDDDALLVLADAGGPTCHLGTPSCFEADASGPAWLAELSAIIAERARSGDASSYTRKLLDEGPERIGKKIGEEGVEVALAGVSRDAAGCAEEVADLIYHVSVLMEARGFGWDDVVALLKERHAKASNAPTASS
jgi:phosphoribosyl-AMP cyclohydrolase / phosphoribosyl-ATP pyrophosphohydrolase